MLILNKLRKFFLNLLFPVNCLGCRQEDFWLCENCRKKILFNYHFICPKCKKNSNFGQVCNECKDSLFVDGCIVVFSYDQEIIRELIKLYKYNYILDIGEILGELTCEFLDSVWNRHKRTSEFRKANLKDYFINKKETILVPVPLHKKRLLERGYNQSEILAKKISDKFGVPVINHAVIRKKYTVPQAQLKRNQRMTNLIDAFSCQNSAVIKNKKVILIDDIYTTGSTINECAKILKESGAKEVNALVIARG